MRTDDGSIIQTCLNGEPEAFGVLVDRYKAGIFAYIYARVTNFQDAQEVTQDVFLAAYQGLSNLKRWERFSSWLFRIAYNHCKKWQRKQIRHPQPETIENMDQKILDNFFVKAYHEEILDQSVHEALNSLPETYREVLMLYYFGDMDSKGIAESLGTSPTAIRMRLSRAREQLKEEMIAMMGTAFENQRLRASFTFRIVEAIKRIKIQPVSQPKSLPWGISLATGLLITILSINPILTLLDHIGTPAYLPLPAESKVLKIGEIPVDVVKTTNTPILSSSIGKGNGGELQNARNALYGSTGGRWNMGKEGRYANRER